MLDSHVVVVELSRNWGHMGAIFAGFALQRQAVILMDADFQDPPEVVPQLIDAWRNGAEVVVAFEKPSGEAEDPGQALSAFLSRPGSSFRLSISLNAGIFGLMDGRRLIPSSRWRKEPYLPGMRAWVGTVTPSSTTIGRTGLAVKANYHL